MTKEEVLQKANEYCSEKGYTNETLTDEFKDKFSDFFSKKYQETPIDDENMIADLQFNLNTAFSATSKGVTAKQKAFDEKENEYKAQIEELNKKLGKRKLGKRNEKKTEPTIPKEIQEQLDELKKFKNEEAKKEKFRSILEIAKKGIRQNLHKSFETFAKGIDVVLDKDEEEQAREMTKRFQEIFMDSIGEIKPLAPKQVQKRDEDFLASLPKVKVV